MLINIGYTEQKRKTIYEVFMNLCEVMYVLRVLEEVLIKVRRVLINICCTEQKRKTWAVTTAGHLSLTSSNPV